MDLTADQCATYAQVAATFLVALTVAVALWRPAPGTSPAAMLALVVPMLWDAAAAIVALAHTAHGARGAAAVVITQGTYIGAVLTALLGAMLPFWPYVYERALKRQARREARRAARAAAAAEVRRVREERQRHEAEEGGGEVGE